jgi:pyruvate/2-oxoglutarate dehydrogenase complex dihydrolipoamide dehydrogenase (E3) component
VIEAAGRLLPAEEPEASQLIADVFAREGIDVRTAARVDTVAQTGSGIRLVLAGDAVVTAQ